MVRLVLRRDRVRLAVWIVSLAAIAYSSVAGVQSLYETEADLAAYARTAGDNATVIVFNGPAYAIDTYGGRTIFELSTQMAIAVAVLALLTVTRHTRAEEESGRAELLRSTRMGRHAQLAGVAIVASLVSVVVGLSLTACLVAAGLPSTGAIAFGAAMAALGICFVGIGAVAAQLTQHSRAASGIGLAVLGVAFVVRAIGDTGPAWLSWLSPIGIAQGTRAYAGERWFTIPLLILLAVALGAGAVALARHRDLGAGLLPDRPGPPVAGRCLSGPIGLSVRLQRGMVLAWSSGLLLIGIAMGWMASSANDFIADNPDIAEIFVEQGVDIVDSFLATMLLMFSLIACGFALQSVVRLRTEESAGRAELTMIAGVRRRTWPLAHLTVTGLGTVVVIGALGLGVGIGHAADTGDLGQIPRLTLASLAHVPAVLVLAGIGVALFGWSSRAMVAAWAPLPFVLVVGMFGDLLDVPGWVSSISPFSHVPEVPARPFDALPELVMLAIAAACLLAGMLGWLRRDVTS
jgi:ABC-2 type transport system permease protein